MKTALTHRMARPRQIIPGTRYLITRRTSQRMYRLRPSPATNAIVAYCLAWAARKTGILIHAFTVMSNHHHLVVTDVEGRLPEFTRELHRTLAKTMNALHGQWENLWSSERVSVIRLPTVQDVQDKVVYSAMNPVAAALVAEPSEWPGVNLWRLVSMEIQRPAVYFSANGRMPPKIRLRLVPPIGEDEKSWSRRICSAVSKQTAAARRRRTRVLGRSRIMAQSPLGRARSPERKMSLRPSIAAQNARVRAACLKADKAFLAMYRSALASWKTGERLTPFPEGTWWMRIHHGVTIADGISGLVLTSSG